MSVEQGELNFSQEPSFEEKREKIAAQYGLVSDDAKSRISQDQEGNWLYDKEPIALVMEALDNLDKKEEDSYMRGQN